MYRFARLDPWWFCQCGRCRFDLPAGGPRGTMYAGLDVVTGVLETIGPEMSGRPVARAFLAERTVWALGYDQPLAFADLTAPRATAFGVTNELSSMTPYGVPQQWAAAFDATGIDGIRYRARFKVDGDASALAVFDAAGAHPSSPKTSICQGDDPTVVADLGRYVDVDDGGAAPLGAFHVIA